tara:strand:+ start:670 stop:861 length:192 start_codon:yes stop_codon:yes gene_type:complete
LAQELGVDFAFPSSTVTIENFLEKMGSSPKYDIDADRINSSIAKVLEEFNTEPSEADKMRKSS